MKAFIQNLTTSVYRSLSQLTSTKKKVQSTGSICLERTLKTVIDHTTKATFQSPSRPSTFETDGVIEFLVKYF